MKIDVVILAAGRGSRMHSTQPKVMHKLAGQPLLEHVVLTAKRTLTQTVDGDNNTSCAVHIVLGHGADIVRKQMQHHPRLNFIHQEKQLGTGHAVKQALPSCHNADIVLVLYGDVPLIKPSTLTAMINLCQGKNLALLTTDMPDPTGYGRIVRNQDGEITAIVEHREATADELAIHEINTGIMAIPGIKLQQWIDNLSCNNAQKEYYLTDIVAQAITNGTHVVNSHPKALTEILGVNTHYQLASLERLYQEEQSHHLMDIGVTLIDPRRIDIRGSLSTGLDIVIDINCVLEGSVKLGNNVLIEPSCIIRNSTIGNNTIIKANSIIEDCIVEQDCTIGPFARLRPGTTLHKNAKIGNFVEIKKAVIGKNSKINHLSYVGDAVIGEACNIGAGTITCNYDGVNKHQTTIDDGAFIGSNTSLVAPVHIGKKSTVGAGSVITRSTSDDSLALERSEQKEISNWHKMREKKQ